MSRRRGPASAKNAKYNVTISGGKGIVVGDYTTVYFVQETAGTKRGETPESIFAAPRRLPTFTGRGDEIERLRQTLTSASRVAVAALHGLGGIGKTQLVVEYAYRYAPSYNLVWWLRAEKAETLLEDFRALADELRLPSHSDANLSRVASDVRQWLEAHSGWLLVADNAIDPRSLERRLPSRGPGHVVITSRNRDWGSIAQLMAIDVLDVDEAAELLLRRSGQENGEREARELAKQLGCLPLALEQAAAYVAENGTTLARYAELYRQQPKKLRAARPASWTQNQATVALTWNLSIESVRATSPAARKLLEICAFLAPDGIPEQLFRTHDARKCLPIELANLDDLAWDATCGLIHRLSLVKRNYGTLSIHRLVQDVLIESLLVKTRLQRSRIAIQLIRLQFPAMSREPSTWQDSARLLPHVLMLAGRFGDQHEPDNVSWLLDHAALYLASRGEYDAAQSLYERALVIRQKALGPSHPDTATTINNLANLHRNRGTLDKAMPLYRQALQIRKRSLGPRDLETAMTIYDLARLLHEQDRLASARRLHARALAIRETACGPDHPETATSLKDLARVLQDQGDLDSARPLFERALSIREAVQGPDHPNTANSLHFLAVLLHAEGRHEEARRLYERALDIRERVLGPDHLNTATTLKEYGALLEDLGELPEALTMYERALAIRERVLGIKNQTTIATRQSLDALLVKLNDRRG